MSTGLLWPVTANGIQKTLGAQLDTGVTASATFNNTTNVQNLKGLFVVDRIDTSGAEKNASLREYISFAGVSGSTVTGLTRGLGGTTDQDHAIGAVVEFVSDVVQQQAILDALSNVVVPSTGAIDTTKVVDLTSAQVLTNKDLSATSNKFGGRTIKRVLSAASYTTDTGTSLNCDTTDMFIVTAQAGALKLNNPTGTPTTGQTLWVSVTGTAARALTYDTQFVASTIALPTTTVTTARLDMGFVWSGTQWIIVAVA